MKDIKNKITYEALNESYNEAIEYAARVMRGRVRKQRALALEKQQEARAEKIRMDKLNQRLNRIAESMGITIESDPLEED